MKICCCQNLNVQKVCCCRNQTNIFVICTEEEKLLKDTIVVCVLIFVQKVFVYRTGAVGSVCILRQTPLYLYIGGDSILYQNLCILRQ